MKRTILALTVISISLCLSAQSLKVSIMGDSYSTFRGYIPRGYAVYYPTQGNNVDSVSQTWWHILVKECGYQLEVNNSYSGSTICNTGYNNADYSDCAFVSRMNEIGNPDILLIFGATNDNWANSPLGDYKYSNISKKDLYTFRPALSYLLGGLKELYPSTRIYFIVNTELKTEITGSITEICGHYNVPMITLHDIDKQNGHPSQAGMRAIADQVREIITKE